MSIGICSLASSSSGNCYFIKSGESSVILDVGIAARKIRENLKFKGSELADVDAILITHEHIDHVKSLKAVLKAAPGAQVYMSRGTFEGIRHKYSDIYVSLLLKQGQDGLHLIKGGESFTVKDMEIRAFNISHDTEEPISYTFLCGGKRVSVVTDTGCVTKEVFDAVRESDILVLESNHEPEILLYGPYPYSLKQRILSDRGHLSNEAAAECLIKIIKSRGGMPAPRVYLAHLSRENNTPEQALLTVRNLLEEESIYTGKDLELSTLKKDEAGPMIFVQTEKSI